MYALYPMSYGQLDGMVLVLRPSPPYATIVELARVRDDNQVSAR